MNKKSEHIKADEKKAVKKPAKKLSKSDLEAVSGGYNFFEDFLGIDDPFKTNPLVPINEDDKDKAFKPSPKVL